METFKTYITYFDQIIQSLYKEEIYLVRSNHIRISHLFYLHLMIAHLKQNSRVLYLTPSNPENIIEDCSFLDFDIKPYLENQQIIILEEPAELDLILSNLNNLETALEDLSSYIDTFKPDFIIINSILSFLSKNNFMNNKIIINRLISFLKEKKTICFIEYTNLDFDLQAYLEKLCYASFSFKYNYKAITHLLNYRIIKSNVNLEIIFSVDSMKYFSIPQLYNTINSTINEIEKVIIHNTLDKLKPELEKYLSRKTQIIHFDDPDEIISSLKDDNREMIFLPTYINNVNGIELAIKTRSTFKNPKIIVVGSRNTNPNQKVRIIRHGVNKFLAYPYDTEEIKKLLDDLYPIKEDLNNRYNIKLLFKDNIEMIHEINESIYFEAINRRFKDFAQEIILHGSSLTFFKLVLNDLNSYVYIQVLKQYQGLIAIFSNQISAQEIHLIAIFKNLKENSKNQITNQIENILGTTNTNKINNGNFLKTLFSPEEFKYHVNAYNEDSHKSINSIVYPYDNLNIDSLLSSVFEYVR